MKPSLRRYGSTTSSMVCSSSPMIEARVLSPTGFDPNEKTMLSRIFLSSGSSQSSSIPNEVNISSIAADEPMSCPTIA